MSASNSIQGLGLAPRSGTTLTVLGCGNLGVAILSGVLASLAEAKKTDSRFFPGCGTATPPEEVSPHQIPSRFFACVRRPESALRIQKTLKQFTQPLTILQNDNIRGVQEADVIILGCKPFMLKEVLDVPGMREALKGKLLISILAGVTAEQIEDTLYGGTDTPDGDRCRVVRAMPNTAAIVRESMTVIGESTPPLPPNWETLVNWIFSRIGRVVTLPASKMDASTSIAGSGPAFAALVLEALADGGVAMGLPRAEAQVMATQVLRGTASMVQNGDHPALIREKVSTPGGCTIGGLMVLEEAGVRGKISKAVREATAIASGLGQTQKANGTK
ncbi:delta 1-pyrroline-5-carboxylate reductase [Coccidioides posadasii str. Silveira]|uniref:Pyrroline-5-carboxylate reductase n=2 Tax=Coccidioides posadasii TaxID=199306 RepID=E9D838_COCPS|nr:pyrroline-5-carboxylate reductase, putative [Coccidioides posadasii C735 delta SOWgp]EER25458.1 pyrroline-5-carboxylate reductase, putative [Coccidioides posadasii C735 delta SOWgp]EFW17547.1 pyrroline-5-carboxylate reductase [Coccidioides posadasii str. Silveira]QVM05542.1 delta 1-pyrroline-5-carboxylate reductase [Coccidioides posadasii str. Silveira]|eukprot:XP_003067603.1 pyrroline-5-carboxylate reductase, putative [Coccidioides posadasii C735 delta SOWgp]